MIFGFSTSFGSSERFSFGGSGAAAGAVSSFLALAGFFAGLAGASAGAAAGSSGVAAVAGASGAAAGVSIFVSSVSAFAFGAFFAGFFSSESAMTKISNG